MATTRFPSCVFWFVDFAAKPGFDGQGPLGNGSRMCAATRGGYP